jgi:hypothetical protein
MIQRYEITHARGEAPLVLIFPEGKWESLPFEIRLLRPWYGSAFCDRASLTAQQRLEIAWQGYSVVAQAAGAPSTGTGAAIGGSLPPGCRRVSNGIDIRRTSAAQYGDRAVSRTGSSGARRAAITKPLCL